MPATRSIPVRRHSSYDPTIFNPPLDLGPAACRFYSWPIESQVSHSQLDDEPRVTTVAGRELAMDPGTSSGDEEVDQLENDNQLENDDQIENEEPGAFDPGEDEEWETDTPDVSPDLQQSTARASALPTTRPAAQPSITTWNTAIYPDQLRATNQLTATITQIALPRPKSVAPTASRSIDALSPHRVTTRSNAPFSAAHRDPKKTNARKTAITRPGYKDYTLSFTVNPKTSKEQLINFRCTTSESPEPFDVPPALASVERTPGDVHVHISTDEVQLWVFKGMGWVVAREGDPHPVLGKSRVLSHREPHNTKLPNWVLHSTLVSYHSRKRVGLM